MVEKKVKGVKVFNNSERRFYIAGADLISGGKREVNAVTGQEFGIIDPKETATVRDEVAKKLEKGYKGDILIWGKTQGKGK